MQYEQFHHGTLYVKSKDVSVFQHKTNIVLRSIILSEFQNSLAFRVLRAARADEEDKFPYGRCSF